MKQQRRNFRSDTVAVSHVIGVVLMVAIFVTMLTIFQASMVPYWNKQVEAAELRVTHDDMMFLPSDIEDVTIHRTPKTCTVQLGAQYPDRMIFRNPGPGAAGTLAVEEEPAQVTVTYYSGSKNIETFDSKRITYQMAGTINSPTLVYEHGVIIADWRNTMGDNAIVTTGEQTLIDINEDLFIPIVNGSSRSKSAIGSETMAIYPYLYTDSINVTWVNVTLDTRYPKLWKDTLLNASTVLADLNLQYTDVGVDIANNMIYINNTAQRYLKYPTQTASEPLYAGMISCSAEDPDGTGGGSSLWVSGEGTDIMATGSRVAHIPSSATATAIVVQDMVVDKSGATGVTLNKNFITITVTDYNGNWWKVLIDFKETDSIMGLVVTNKGGSSTYYYNGNPVSIGNLMPFNQSTVIDLFDPANFTPPDGGPGLYQNAGVRSNNRLVTNIAHEINQKKVAMISYRLLVDGP
jgi:hypothetical protein